MSKIPTDSQWSDLVSKVKAKQDQLTAGSGISIVEDPYTDTTVISASGGAPMEVTTTPVGQMVDGVQQITWTSQNTFAELCSNAQARGVLVNGHRFSNILFDYGSSGNSGNIENIIFADTYVMFGTPIHPSVEHPSTFGYTLIISSDGTGVIQGTTMFNRQTLSVSCSNGITDYAAGTAPLDNNEVFKAFYSEPGRQIVLLNATPAGEKVEIISADGNVATAVSSDKIYRITMTGSKTNNNAAWTVEEYPFQNISLMSTDPGEGQPLAANNFIGVYDA